MGDFEALRGVGRVASRDDPTRAAKVARDRSPRRPRLAQRVGVAEVCEVKAPCMQGHQHSLLSVSDS